MRTRFRIFLVVFVSALITGAAFSQVQTKSAGAKPTAPASSSQISSGGGPSNQSSSSDASSRLPVKRVVLYKNGVGYFEHAARVHGNQELAIDFTTSQLNDVLKSLTVVDLGDGRISGVRYNSIAPLDERLKGLRLPFGEAITRSDFLTAMRGSRVEVRSKGEAASGRLLSVEQEERTTDSGTTYNVTEFSVMTDAGEMKNFELGPAVSVRLAEHDLNQEVGRYLDLVGSSRAKDLRRMSISATGSGDRDIFVSYISEVPVWKSTYRIILPEKAGEKPLLQGWAIVDNTIGEDWKDVQLSLIAGAPQSFIQDISQPLYGRRPVVPLPEAAMLTPQTQEATMQENAPVSAAGVAGRVDSGERSSVLTSKQIQNLSLEGRDSTELIRTLPGFSVYNGRGNGTGTVTGTVTDQSGAVVARANITIRNERTGQNRTTTSNNSGYFAFSGLGSGTYAVRVAALNFKSFEKRGIVIHSGDVRDIPDLALQVGSSGDVIEVTGTADEIAPGAERKLLSEDVSEAQSQDLGDYFEYNLKQSITIGKNQSALVPILQARIEAEKVTLWSANGQPPLRALWIKNASGQTLDSGTFNIVDSGTFAGEGLIETVHPDERRLLSYAADTAVRVTSESEYKDQPVSHIRVAKGVIFITREQRSKMKYTIRNADTAARQVVIEHPVRAGWKLAEGSKPEETTASYYRFRVAVDPNKTSELAIEEFIPQTTTAQLTDLSDGQMDALRVENRMTPGLEKAFRQVIDQKNVIARLQSEIETRQQELNAINRDQGRIRENMKALKGSPEEKALLQRYTGQLNSQEDRLTTLNKEIADLQQKQTVEQQRLDATVQQVALDESF